jgi:RimJ/RimL family protein N-acetyltransferase
MNVRRFERQDWPEVWTILAPVFAAGETYAFPQDMTEERTREVWTAPPKQAFVAVEDDGRIVGTYFLRPNFEGPEAHVCNGGYVVALSAQGRGVAAAMCRHSQRQAMEQGFRAMQFNMVVSTNRRAVELWKRMGFTIVGTLPEAFRHPTFGYVDAYVMHKFLTPAEE